MVYKIKEYAKIILALGIVCLAFHITGVGCPFQYMTGISCAGCGMTRAWLCVLHLDFPGAFAYHPLFWTVPLIGTAWVFHERLPEKLCRAGILFLILSFALVYLLRLVNPADPVVQADVKEGVLFKFFLCFKNAVEWAAGK